MAVNQAKILIEKKIESKENQIKTRQLQLQAGKFEKIVDLIEIEIKNLQKDIEFLKSVLFELDD